ncbi:S41 family peptidase, partial [Winogradskyella alexanderae]
VGRNLMKMKKWLKIALWSITSLILIIVIFGFAFYKRFVVSPPDHTFSEPRNILEDQQQDLEYLALYPDYDRSFDTQIKRDSFFSRIDHVKRRLPLSQAAFEMEVARALAFADNGHTNISAGARARRLNNIPLRVYWFKEGLYTILSMEGYEQFLGKRILSFNGIPPEELLIKMKPWYGGTVESLKARSPLYFISPEIMHAIGLSESSDSIQISIEDDNGNVQTHDVFALEEEKEIPGYWVPYWLNPYSKINNTKWKSCKSEKHNSLTIKNIYRNVHHEFINKTLYVQINDNYNTDERHLGKYLKLVSEEMKEKQPNQIVFDLRFNPGGDNYHLPWPFIRSMNDYLRDDQKCWIITGHDTFSAGLITASYAKYTLGEKAIIVGEKVGDRMQFWADGGVKMTLPNSRISPRIWTAFNDWGNGCHDLSKCFWIAYFDSFPAGNLDLDKKISLSFSDYFNGRDSVLDYIIGD